MMAPMKITFIAMLLCFLPLAKAAERSECYSTIQKHIFEAIEHNREVSLRYSKLTDGKSLRLSHTLINLERMSALLVKNIERQTRPYQEKGIGLLCEEIADMKLLPEFQDRLPEIQRPESFISYDYKKLSKRLRKLLKNDQLEDAYKLLSDDILALESTPNQLCLTRHFLESMAITLKLSDKHRSDASAANLADPLPIIKKFITLQRRALFLTYYLDHKAFPLQKEGILIFCQDVPVINWK